jgi:spermidine synthase
MPLREPAGYTRREGRSKAGNEGDCVEIADLIYRILGWKILASAKIDGRDVVVVEKGGRRELVYDHVIHSRLYNNSVYSGQYWDYFVPLPAVFPKPKMLIVGLGGGTVPFRIQKLFGKKVKIDVVEISREMVAMSRAFLPERLDANIIVEDGNAYLSRKKAAYEIIISDPYVGDGIPSAFFEEQYVKNCNRALKGNGILAINYALTFQTISRKPDLIKKLRKFFKVYVLHYPNAGGNIVLVCSKKYNSKEIARRIRKNFKKDKENEFLFKAYAGMK